MHQICVNLPITTLAYSGHCLSISPGSKTSRSIKSLFHLMQLFSSPLKLLSQCIVVLQSCQRNRKLQVTKRQHKREWCENHLPKLWGTNDNELTRRETLVTPVQSCCVFAQCLNPFSSAWLLYHSGIILRKLLHVSLQRIEVVVMIFSIVLNVFHFFALTNSSAKIGNLKLLWPNDCKATQWLGVRVEAFVR